MVHISVTLKSVVHCCCILATECDSFLTSHVTECITYSCRDVLATRLTQSEINMLEESRRMRGKRLRIKTKQALNATPTAVALVLVFPVFLGIMMAFVVPLFKVSAKIQLSPGLMHSNSPGHTMHQQWEGCDVLHVVTTHYGAMAVLCIAYATDC